MFHLTERYILEGTTSYSCINPKSVFLCFAPHYQFAQKSQEALKKPYVFSPPDTHEKIYFRPGSFELSILSLCNILLAERKKCVFLIYVCGYCIYHHEYQTNIKLIIYYIFNLYAY